MYDWNDLRYFKKEEWGKDPDKVTWKLVVAIDALRSKLGVPIHIHCAWDQKGHAANSQHYLGNAVDLHINEKFTPLEEYRMILTLGCVGGVGWYPDWKPRPGWHIDIRDTPTRWYQKNGRYIYGELSLMQALQDYSK